MPYYYAGGMDSWLWAALIAVFVLGLIAQSSVKRTFARYAKVHAKAGLPAHAVAERLMRENGGGYASVSIKPVGGRLTDHYNPKTNEVGLSTEVYQESSVAALAVAAHEIGHVMQYQEEYGAIRVRNAILPVASFGSQAAPLIVLAGILIGSFNLAFLGVALFTLVFAFQLLTLPVEFNASSRAIAMLEDGGYLTQEETPMARRVLRAAAFTYVVAALSSLVTLMRFILMARQSRRNH